MSQRRVVRSLYKSLLATAERVDRTAPWLVPHDTLISQHQDNSARELVRDAFRQNMNVREEEASKLIDGALECLRYYNFQLSLECENVQAQLQMLMQTSTDKSDFLEYCAYLVARLINRERIDEKCNAQLDELASEVRQKLQETPGPSSSAASAATVCDVLFRDQGFCGNVEAFSDINNCDIGWVLRNRAGIPISLALVFVLVARRAGICADGIDLPGRFMARVHSNMCPPMYVDVFNGRLVSEKRMQEVAAPFGVPEDILKPADSADILLRMARNIHRASQKQGDERLEGKWSSYYSQFALGLADLPQHLR